jgi:hypothetical protein
MLPPDGLDVPSPPGPAAGVAGSPSRASPARRDARRILAHSAPSFISFSRPDGSNMRLNSAAAHKSLMRPSSDLNSATMVSDDATPASTNTFSLPEGHVRLYSACHRWHRTHHRMGAQRSALKAIAHTHHRGEARKGGSHTRNRVIAVARAPGHSPCEWWSWTGGHWTQARQPRHCRSRPCGSRGWQTAGRTRP